MNDPKENFYDKEIAPLLLEIRNKCQSQEIPFLAVAFISPELWGDTAFIPANCNNAHIRTVQMAIKAGGNADTLIWGMQRHAKEHGHEYACLTILEWNQKT